MQRYLSPAQLLNACELIIANYVAGPGSSPLDELLSLLYEQRGYFWIGIYFVIGERVVRQAMQGPMPPRREFALGKGNVGTAAMRGVAEVIPDVKAGATYGICFREVKSELVIPLRIGARTLGVLDVESDRANAFGSVDRILLEGVSAMLARFLTGKGKVLLRHARERASVEAKFKTAAGK